MDSFIIEMQPLYATPSADARLVIFADETIHTDKADVNQHLVRCAAYAKEHGVYLVTGLLVHNDNLCLCLINPRGKAICRQAALHLPPLSPLRTADKVEVIHTELGNLYLCVDEDIAHPQTIRAAALKGADMVISVQQLDPLYDTDHLMMCTVWNAAQSNNMYIIHFSGNKSMVTCPAPLTRSGDGYLVRRTSNIPTRFGLNMPRLDEIRSRFEIMEHINTQLISNYAKELSQSDF